MHNKEVEPEDPLEIVGIQLDDQNEEQLRDMALCFAEEFVREGWSEDKLFSMFKNPLYQGPYLAWQQKDDEYILSIIQEAINMWRPKRGNQ